MNHLHDQGQPCDWATAEAFARQGQPRRHSRHYDMEGSWVDDDDDLRLQSFQVYNSIVRSPSSPQRDRALAQMQIDRLLGLSRPQRVAVRVEGARNEDAERLALARQKVIADPQAAELACLLVERLADAEQEKRNGGCLPCGLRELDRPSPPNGNGEASRE
jgi:hypothetical protein